ncbi:transposase [Methylobacterium trifolii]
MSGFGRRFEPRRLELINGAGGRRVWSADAKAAVLDETLLPGAVVSVMARRHGLTPQQVFGWRREARRALEAERAPTAVGFVPALVTEPTPEPLAAPANRSRHARRRDPATTGIELEISGVAVRVGPGASGAQIAAVIRALKATA